MPICSFSFGQLEELLATVHHIAPDRRMAFQGRLKHLQRWGFPTGEKPGKGRAIAYSIEHLFRAVLALELIQAGINPKFAVDIINSKWDGLRTTVYLNSFTGTERVKYGGGSQDDWYWLARPEALRSLTKEGESEYDKYEAIKPVPADDLPKMLGLDATRFGSVLGAHWRTLVINGGPLVRGVLFVIEHEFKWAVREDMVADLREAIDLDQSRKHQIAETFAADFAKVAKKVRAERKKRAADEYPFTDAYPELVSRAETLLGDMPAAYAEILRHREGEEVELSKEAIEWMANRRLISITAEELAITPLGFVIGELIRKAENACDSQA